MDIQKIVDLSTILGVAVTLFGISMIFPASDWKRIAWFVMFLVYLVIFWIVLVTLAKDKKK